MRRMVVFLTIAVCLACSVCRAQQTPGPSLAAEETRYLEERSDVGVWIGGTTHRPVVTRKADPVEPPVAIKEPDRTEPKSVSAAPAGKQRRHQMDEFKYSEQSVNEATNVYGTIHAPVVWQKAKSPYIVTENLFVAEDGTLTIEPGVIVKVTKPSRGPNSSNDDTIGITVNGALIARGTPSEMIWFTSASANPTKYSDWSGIRLGCCKPSILTWAVVEYASPGVDCYSCALIAHCVFRYCHTGIWMWGDFVGDVRHNVSAFNAWSGIRGSGTRGEASVLDNIFYRNGDGIDFWGSAVAYADHNLYWSTIPGQNSSLNYNGNSIPGTHDIVADPRFASQGELDFRLADDSPAKGAASDGKDIGLDIKHWSASAAQKEVDEWLADGARELWSTALYGRRKQFGNLEPYEQALSKTSDPELKAKILCAIGAEAQYKDSETTLKRLDEALKLAQKPATRDLVRMRTAELLMNTGKPEQAVKIVKTTEWPQSKIWAEPALAKYSVAAGDMDTASAYLDKIAKTDSYQHLETVTTMITQAINSGKLSTAESLLQKFQAYPASEQAFECRLAVADALRAEKQYEKAAELLKTNDKIDPFNRRATQSLSVLADILEKNLEREDEARKVREELVTNYFSYDSYVSQAKTKLGDAAPSVPRNKLVLLDETEGKCSIYDRSMGVSCNFSTFAAIKALTDHGLTVHSNGNARATKLTAEVMSLYGVVIMNGRYGADSEPPMSTDAIDAVVDYVKNGGCLLVISCGNQMGSGREAQFFNPLMSRFGLTFQENTAIPYTDRMARLADIIATDRVKTFNAPSGVPVLYESGQVLAKCGEQPVIVEKSFGKGKVIASGTGSSFLGGIMEAHRPEETAEAEQNRAAFAVLVDYCLKTGK